LVAADLGISHFQGTVIGKDNGILGCRSVAMRGLRGQKVAALHQLTRFMHTDLQRSIALGNTSADVGLFELVGRPIAFEPSRRLRTTALRNGWDLADRHSVLDLCQDFCTPERIARRTADAWAAVAC
jgi:putative phosphoserine phosphatase/1-acylglycerol-3-phosphate O-acyltransferase